MDPNKKKKHKKDKKNLTLNFKAIFKFRGICNEVDKMDTDYILMTDTIENGNYSFQGLAGQSSIVFNRCKFHQHFTSTLFNESIMKMHSFFVLTVKI